MPRWVSVGGEGETLGTTNSKPAGLDYLIGPKGSKGGPPWRCYDPPQH